MSRASGAGAARRVGVPLPLRGSCVRAGQGSA
jgi:hypothetical protein